MFSIIIPTYNRQDALKLTLQGYLNQTCATLIDELIVVDDGSTDGTRSVIETFDQDLPFDLDYLYQDNMGPAEARNKGMHLASGDLLLITGDDIVPHQDMIKEHFVRHKMGGFAKNLSVLGKTVWPPDMRVTPFMRHINEMGLQFGYSIIPDANDVPFNFFYTSNISLHREFLLEGELFDTNFPHAAWEDIELAYRLKERGLKIVYNENALGYHHHPISFASFRHRQEKSGYAAHIFYQKHPELKDFLRINSSKPPASLWQTVRLVEAFCMFSERFLPMSFSSCYDLVMNYYYSLGVYRNNDDAK
jgi:glycosyltransferase involved in cell wall biosynthesis